MAHDSLVLVQSQGSRLLEKVLVRHETDLKTLLLGGVWRYKVALVHKVAAQRGDQRGRDCASRAEGLEPVCRLHGADIQIPLVDLLLVLWAVELADTWPRGVDVERTRVCGSLEVDVERGFVVDAGIDLGGVQRQDVGGNGLHRLLLEVHVVDAQVAVEPRDLVVDNLARDELAVGHQLRHLQHLRLLAKEHVLVVRGGVFHCSWSGYQG